MKRWGKGWRTVLLILLFLSVGSPGVWAQEAEAPDASLLEESGAADLILALPEETQDLLEESGVTLIGAGGLELQNLGQAVWRQIREEIQNPLKTLGRLLAAVVLCALVGTLKPDGITETSRTVGALFVGLTVAVPVSQCIRVAAEMVKCAGVFILSCTPVMAGIMAASGQTASASAHSFLMLGAGDVISLVASTFMVPVLQVFLMLSLISGLSPTIQVEGLCDAFYKALKWTLGFCMTIFSAILGVQSVLTANADAVGLRAAKFAVSSFVPVVGSALSDAITTVNGSLRALKSGVGAIGVLGVALVVTPVLLQCFVWYLVCFCGQAAAGLMGVKNVTGLLRGIGKCVEMILLTLICCLVIMAVASATVWVGGAGG